MPVLAIPLALLGLVGVPILTGIYIFRTRSRRTSVSSLMLWTDQRLARKGGRRVERMQLPLLFFLEILAMALLVLAAAEPKVETPRAQRPLVVVLDDSYSMLSGSAGAAGGPRRRAIKAIEKILDSDLHEPVHLVLAGSQPLMLGASLRSTAEVKQTLERWKCDSAQADLDRAVAFAAARGGRRCRILIVTDRPPEKDPGKGPVQWWSFGKPLSNVAFVGASRQTTPQIAADGAKSYNDQCFLAFSNLSTEQNVVSIALENGAFSTGRTVARIRVQPNQTVRKIVKALRPDAPVIATLRDDNLAADNKVYLVAQDIRPVRTLVSIKDKDLRSLVADTLRATGMSTLVTRTELAELVITDRSGALPAKITSALSDGSTWVLRLIAEKDAKAYLGPFVVDRSHALTDGLGLGGVIWSCASTKQLPGRAIVTAGNVPLLSDKSWGSKAHEIRLRLRIDLSTLQNSPNWPILFWNLLKWRRSQSAGFESVNVRLGREAVLTMPRSKSPEEPKVVLTGPDGESSQLAAVGAKLSIEASELGLHWVGVDSAKFPFAVNTLSRDESDLSGCESGRWGNWISAESLRYEYRSIAWIAALITLLVLTIHMGLIARSTMAGDASTAGVDSDKGVSR